MLGVEYQVHVEGYGWTKWKKNGQVAGTTGESRRCEAIRFRLIDKPENEEIFLHGNAHVENIGWLGFVPENEVCGTTGQARKLEALQFSLVGKDADKYSINFRSHSQDLGTQDWAKDGEFTGSEGAGLRIEAVQMILTDKGVDLGLQDVPSFRHFDPIPVAPPAPETPQDMASEHFAWIEYACDCIRPEYNFGWCDGYPDTAYGDHSMSPELLQKIEQLRVNIGVPITVTSGIRCPSCNSYWGGASDSLHMDGEAADLVCGALSVDELADAALNVGLGVIRYYSSRFVHVQVYPRDTVGD
jgi:uncharacterized protein YjdB